MKIGSANTLNTVNMVIGFAMFAYFTLVFIAGNAG
jgi:hypothetical protein